MVSSISALAEIIQIAVAPVFLLAGIAGFLMSCPAVLAE